MKRAPELTDLSRDHHHALVLARRCVRVATPEAAPELLAETWEAAKVAFSVELEPHFSVEERLLLPSLATAGETGLVERTRREHTRLRDLIGLDAERAVLLEFGELLSGHVRFEEQEVFPCAERVLNAEELTAVATASAGLETARQRARRRSEPSHDEGPDEIQ